jgi:hypothetical protein
MKHVFIDSSGTVQPKFVDPKPPPQPTRGRGRPRTRPVWDAQTAIWVGPPPAGAAATPQPITEPPGEKSEDEVLGALKAKSEREHDAWEVRQRKLYGAVYHHDPADPTKLIEPYVTVAEEFEQLVERSLVNGELIPKEGGWLVAEDGVRYGWKNPSEHDPNVRAEDWYPFL